MNRSLEFTEGHEIFRESIAKFIENEIVDNYSQWEADGMVPREIWSKSGENGYLVPWAPEKYGGAGADYLYSIIINEELSKRGLTGFMIVLHNDIVAPYIDSFGSEEQKDHWLPRCVSGETILAVAMTEPEAGSDLASIRTTARREGGSWIINGQKTFISNGITADLVIVAAKTGDAKTPPHESLSLFLIERDTPGFSKGEPIKKIGLKAQDTAELFFDSCKIPEENILGGEGMGFQYLAQQLQGERLAVAVGCQVGAEACLDMTIEYVKERNIFERPLSKFQNTKFVLAELASEIAYGRSFIDDLIRNHAAGNSIVKETCMGKYMASELVSRVADRCLQLFGGYGYCVEYPISRAFVDSRINSIYAGTSEIMKIIIAQGMGL